MPERRCSPGLTSGIRPPEVPPFPHTQERLRKNSYIAHTQLLLATPPRRLWLRDLFSACSPACKRPTGCVFAFSKRGTDGPRLKRGTKVGVSMQRSIHHPHIAQSINGHSWIVRCPSVRRASSKPSRSASECRSSLFIWPSWSSLTTSRNKACSRATGPRGRTAFRPHEVSPSPRGCAGGPKVVLCQHLSDKIRTDRHLDPYRPIGLCESPTLRTLNRPTAVGSLNHFGLMRTPHD